MVTRVPSKKTQVEIVPELLTMEQAARLLSISRTMVYELASNGKLPVWRLDGFASVRIPRTALMKFIEDRTTYPVDASKGVR